MVPGQRGRQRGSAAPAHRQPAAGLDRRRADDHRARRIYFGERPSSYVVVGAQQNEFDYPTGESDAVGSIGTETRWTGTSGIRLDNTLMRLLFALRFRDLDLLISDQVTREQPAALPSLAERPPDADRAVPALRQGSVPRHRRRRPDGLRPGRVHDVGPLPERPALRPAAPLRPDRARNDALRLHPEQRQDHRRRLRRHDALLRQRPDDPIIRAYQGVFPDLFEPLSTPCRPTCATHLRVPEELFNVQTTHVRALPRHRTPSSSSGADDLWTVPTQTSEQTLPSEAYYVEMRLPSEDGRRVPPAPADGPDRAGRT